MKITRTNYEPFFLDFLEDNLKEDLVDEFLDFLEQNPDLKEELHQIENLKIPEEQITFAEKQQLYKSTFDEIDALENRTIAYLEGDLENKEQKSFEAYLASHPKQQNSYNLYTKTHLFADSEIKYPDKQKLYRKTGAIRSMKWVARIAAIFLLILGINSLYQNRLQQQQTSNLVVADSNQKDKTITGKKETEKLIGKELMAVKESKPRSSKSFRKHIDVSLKENQPMIISAENRDLTALSEIAPRFAKLEDESTENQLAVSYSIKVLKINDPGNIVTLDEFLVSRAKKVSKGGLNSAQRILRFGLGLASELSGDRIGYSLKEGKITRIDFESRLMAFSIPLEKNPK